MLEEKPEATPEKSLMKKLEKIQEQKHLNKIKQGAVAAPKAVASKGYVDEDMKKALKRDNALTPEAMEGWEKIHRQIRALPALLREPDAGADG